jgi:hypothetical protein
MSASKKLIQASAGNVAGGDFYPYTIENSARFDSSGPNYLEKTLGTATDRKKFTFSFWVKPCEFIHWQSVLGTGSYLAGAYIALISTSTGATCIRYLEQISSANAIKADFIGSLRDPSSFYHIVVVRDTTEATDTDRVRLYVNGTRFTEMNGTPIWPSLNRSDFYINGPVQHSIGETLSSNHGIYPLNAYLSEVVFIDGQALDPTSFGEDKNGIWVPKDVSGLTFGTNGFYLDFANSANLGNDVSGNNNDFTSSGLTSSDQMIDTPTNNFATLNRLLNNSISDGNLYHTYSSGSYDSAVSTLSVTSGKWYAECTITKDSVYPGFGIVEADAEIATKPFSVNYLGSINGGGYGFYPGQGWYRNNGVLQSNTTSISTGSVIGLALDLDSSPRTIKVYDDGTLIDTLSNIDLPSAGYIFSTSINTNGSSAAGRWNFGQTAFVHTPPTDHLALSTANLPEPTIGPNIDENSSGTTSDEHFDIALWTGTGTTQNITSLEFQPDFIWIKNRDDAAQSHWLFDAIRGVDNVLFSNLTNAETNDSGLLSSFNTDGFTTDSNKSLGTGDDFVAWNWKGNGSGVSNTDGSITSAVSANQDAGISIVTYTGNATANATIGHGLGVTPQFFAVKVRSSTGGWWTYHVSVGKDAYLDLSSTAASASSANYWGSTGPTSTTFQINGGGGVNNSGSTYVAYCFAEVESFSSFGSYTGNGSADGPFIYTGCRPAFVMVKRTDTGNNWVMHDAERNTYNVVNLSLLADRSDAETDFGIDFDFLSNGFKIRSTNNPENASGGTYIYMAFAENPFKYANAR